MAATTVLGSIYNTTAGDKTVVATPAVGDLIVIVAADTAAAALGASDNNSDGLGTYTAATIEVTSGANTDRLRVFVRDALIGSASSTTFTSTQTTSTGGGMVVYAISGMSRAGLSAIRSKGTQGSATAGTTPAPVLDLTPLTGNPVISAIQNATNPGGVTARSSPAYTRDLDGGFTAPVHGMDSMHIDSGETSATITWGSTSATAFASVAVELDTSAAGIATELLVAADANENGNWYVTHLDQEAPEEEAYWGGTIGAESAVSLDCVAAVLVGPPAPDQIQAAQDYNEDYYHDDESEDAWAAAVFGFPDQTLDVTPTLFPPAVSEPIETFVAQPTFGEHDFATQIPVETEDYAQPPEQNEWTAPPEVPSTELLAAQPTFQENPFWALIADETDDYAAPPDEIEWTAPPEVPLSELLAAQPIFAEQDAATLVPDETQDYDSPSVLEVPTEIFPPPSDQEAQAAGQLPEHDGFTLTPAETDDYDASVSLDVTPQLFPPAVIEPIETFAAQALPEQPWFADTEVEDYLGPAEQLEFLAPPEVPLSELAAAQPHYGEWFWDAEETQDYAADSTIEVGTLYPVPPSDEEAQAEQPDLSGTLEPWFPAEDLDVAITDPASTLDVSVITAAFPPATDAEAIAAAAFLFDQPFWPADETEDYANDAALDVSVQVPAPPASTDEEIQAAQPNLPGDIGTHWPAETDDPSWHTDTPLKVSTETPPPPSDGEMAAATAIIGEWWWAEEETDQYTATSTLEVGSLYPVPDAELIAAQPAAPEIDWPVEDAVDDSTSVLDVSALIQVPTAQIAELIAALPAPELPWLRSEELDEDYLLSSTVEITFLFAAPPVPGPKAPVGARPVGTGADALPQTNPVGATPQGGAFDADPQEDPNRLGLLDGSTDAREV